jgi:uncharacterized protein (TIGR03083 family)
LDHPEYLGVLREHGAALAVTARSAPLDTPVPSCAPWTLLDLVGHLGGHHRWVAGNLDRTPDQGMFPFAELEPAPDALDAADWLDAGVEMLATKLETIGEDAPCWTWADQPSAKFWARRTAHETVVHGWDGRNAARTAEPLATDIAIDGTDEYLTLVPLRFWAATPTGNDESIEICSLDGPATWHIALDRAGMHVSRDSRPSDATVSGDASSVFLYLMGRGSADSINIDGDRAVLDNWRELAKF